MCTTIHNSAALSTRSMCRHKPFAPGLLQPYHEFLLLHSPAPLYPIIQFTRPEQGIALGGVQHKPCPLQRKLALESCLPHNCSSGTQALGLARCCTSCLTSAPCCLCRACVLRVCEWTQLSAFGTAQHANTTKNQH